MPTSLIGHAVRLLGLRNLRLASRHRREGTVPAIASLAVMTVVALAAAPASVQVLTNHGNQTGSISVIGEVDTWTFTANAGDALTLSITQTAGNTANVLDLFVYSPSGVGLASAGGHLTGWTALTAPATGNYTVKVSADPNVSRSTGDYILRLARMPAGNVVAPSGDEGGDLINLANNTGSIPPGDLDIWAFNATAGDALTLSIAETSVDPGNNVLNLRLFDPDGLGVTSAGGHLTGWTATTATKTGRYTVLVLPDPNLQASTGDYVLRLARVPIPSATPAGDEGGVLVNGGNETGTITPGDLDLWTLQAKAGDTLYLSIAETSIDPGNNVLNIRVFDPDGVGVTSAGGHLTGWTAIRAVKTGTYFVLVLPDGNLSASVGDYVVRLARTPDNPPAAPGDEGGPITNGTFTARLDLGDLDPWSFYAQQGDHIVLTLQQPPPNPPNQTALIAGTWEPDGTPLGSWTTQFAFTARKTGVYNVVISPDGNLQASTGNYQLGLSGASATPPPPSPETTGKQLGRPCEHDDPRPLPYAPNSGNLPCAGNPVSIGSGNKVEEVLDYTTAGSKPLRFARYYNSFEASEIDTSLSSLGRHWRSTFDRYLRTSGASVLAERQTGRVLTFANGAGGWTADSDVDFLLTHVGGAWTLSTPDDTSETYTQVDAALAVLTEIRFQNGYTQTLEYNASRQLTRVVDSLGRMLLFTYAGDRLASLTTPDGAMVSFMFDASTAAGLLDRLILVTNADGSSQRYLYEDARFPLALTGLVDENGARYATWAYNDAGRAISSEHAGGVDRTTIEYDDAASTRAVTNALGLKTTYHFALLQGVPKLLQEERAATTTTAAGSRTFSYDARGYLATQVDWRGVATAFLNDSRGLPTQITEAVGTSLARVVSIDYDVAYHLPTRVERPGVTVEMTYDADGNLLTRSEQDTSSTTTPYVTTGDTRTWSYAWTNGLLTSMDGPRTDVADVSQFSYDSAGNLTATSNGLGHLARVTRSTPGGLPQTIVDENGVTTDLSYDARQRLIATTVQTASGALTTTFGYDLAGNLVTHTSPDGASLTIGYDPAHRPVSFVDATAQKMVYVLDGLGNRVLTAALNPGGAARYFRAIGFDSLGRPQTIVEGAGQTTRIARDANGNAIAVVDPKGRVTRQEFDALNRLVRTTDPAGGVVASNYDPSDRLLRVVAPNGAVTSYAYDGFGRRIQETSADSGNTIYHYDAADDLTQRIDAAGVVTNMAYDAINRLLTVAYPGGASENVSYRYDEAAGQFGIGRLTSLTDAVGTLSRRYDERGNVVNESRHLGTADLNTGYQYDRSDRVHAMTYPSGAIVTYGRNAAGQVNSVTLNGSPIASNIGYEPFGPVGSLTYGNGIAETRQFDTGYRLKGVSSLVQRLTYSYDPADNIASIVDGLSPTQNQTFVYDTLDRLTSASGIYGALSYSYDANGNRTRQQDGGGTTTYTYGAQTNRLTQLRQGNTQRLFGYSATGNTTSIANVPNTTPALGIAYNQAGRMSRVSSGNTVAFQYSYDAFGQRVLRVAGASATFYQYDLTGRLIAEVNTPDQGGAEYIYLDDRPIATRDRATGRISMIHTDHLGTPRLATDSNSVTWAGIFRPFGEPVTAGGAITQSLRFPGQEAEIGGAWNHNGFRDYFPSTGRYWQADPIGLAGGLNPYAYARSRPMTRTDRTGLSDAGDLGELAQSLADNHLRLEFRTAAGPKVIRLGKFLEPMNRANLLVEGAICPVAFFGTTDHPEDMDSSFSFPTANQCTSLGMAVRGLQTWNNFQCRQPSREDYPLLSYSYDDDVRKYQACLSESVCNAENPTGTRSVAGLLWHELWHPSKPW